MILKKIRQFAFFILITLVFATPSVVKAQIRLTASFENCSVVDSFALYESRGMFKTKVASAKADANGVITFNIPASKFPKFYFLGLNNEQERLRPIILGTENNLKLSGPCYNMQLTTVEGSKLNDAYADAIKKVNALKVDMNKVVREYQREYNNATLRTELEAKMATIDLRKKNLMDSFRKVNPVIGRIVALDTYTSYQNSQKKKDFKDEIEYFAKQYFQYVDWKDTMYNHVPYIYDMFRGYAQVVSMKELGLSKDQQKKYYEEVLNTIPGKSPANKYALSGILNVLSEQQNPLLVELGDRFLTDFPDEDPVSRANFAMMINQIKAQMIDIPAPEIAMTDTTLANIRRLSDLKGKYVLIDFWASWCGPCRRENPNVVKLYHKYKDKGFDIFSVSLDSQRDRWVKAIHDDGLEWSSHVSDLKFWQNEAAKMYAVTSIPRTVLVDRNGTIVARDLRGPTLEEKLKEIFGE